MVAAWISADTGVGPAMASGSHACSGICALLPVQPRKINRQAAVISPDWEVSAAGSAVRNHSLIAA